MAIDKETNKTAGVGGFNAESSDNSITIEDAGKDTKDFKVNWDEMPLVTEDENGKARAFDKLVNDHSLHNVAYMRHGETAEDNETALTDTDSMYTPKTGQMLNWIDGQGKQHISRYVKMERYNPLPSELPWTNAAYDDEHGTFIVLAMSDIPGTPNGNLTVAVRSFYNKWQLIETGHWNESWKHIAAGGGYVVALSGNRSREFAVSSDGGYTWNLMTLPDDLYWTKVKYMSGEFYFFSRSGTVSDVNYWGKVVSTADFNSFVAVRTGDASGFTVDIWRNDAGEEVEIVQKPGGNYFLKNANAEILLATLSSDTQVLTDLQVVGDYAIVYSGEGGSISMDLKLIRISDVWGNSPSILYTKTYIDEWGTFLLREYKGELAIFVVRSTTNPLGMSAPIITVVKFSAPYSTIKQITLPDSYRGIMRGFTLCGKYALIAAGNFAFDTAARNGNAAQLIDLEEFEFVEPFEYWEELPQIQEDSKGLLCCENKVVGNATVGEPYLIYKNKAVAANASDRTTEYSNYRLTRGDVEIWCMAERNDIVDNTTKVYSDEDCTAEIGIITNHNYNINNPNDTEVLIDGETFVFTFIDSKIPVFLATTAAIIEALKKKVDVGTAIYYKANGTGPWVAVAYTWNTNHYEAVPATNPGFIVAITTDGQEPANDLSNIYALYQWTAGSSFGIRAAANFTTEAHGDAPIYIEL